ncbi:MAG: transcription termination factor Rho [Planctomycetota bacterium]
MASKKSKTSKAAGLPFGAGALNGPASSGTGSSSRSKKVAKKATKTAAKNTAAKQTATTEPVTKQMATTKKAAAKKKTVTKKTTAKKAATKKVATKKTATKKAASKKVATKKAATKKTAVKKTAVKKTVAEKATAKKEAVKKEAVKKASSKKATATKASTKKSASKKTASKKTTGVKAKSRAKVERSVQDVLFPVMEESSSPVADEPVAVASGAGESAVEFPGFSSPVDRDGDTDRAGPIGISTGEEDSSPVTKEDTYEQEAARDDRSNARTAKAADDDPWGTSGEALSRREEKRRRWKERRQRGRGRGAEVDSFAGDGTDSDAPGAGSAGSQGADAPGQGSAGKENSRAEEAAPKEPAVSPWAAAKERRGERSRKRETVEVGAGDETTIDQPRGRGHGRGRQSAPERAPKAPKENAWAQRKRGSAPSGAQGGGSREVEGILVIEGMNHGHLRSADNNYFASKDDAHVSPQMVQRLKLRSGSKINGRVRRGQGRHKWELSDVALIDAEDPSKASDHPLFKSLTSIDPDFHYAVGDGSGEVSLKVVDILCPIGRGQRGLIVAPPRSGKTVLLQQFAHAMEKIYPEVHLMVLLVDERPEEATEWQRALKTGEVFVSTNDELPEKHVELAEVVWARATHLVEQGEDVMLLMDSITRLGRAYNNIHSGNGKTMSGGIDSRALERPKQFFGAARNTETAGSLTILGTTLIETGSRMDQVIFEEFKGTGNMELVLARRLADRRIFPAIDIERSGTRKEEKLLSSTRHRRVSTLRRVLLRMHWAEAMELLVSKLEAVDKLDDFLQRFDLDPEE